MNKKIDPWKLKELSQRPTKDEVRSTIERAQMEENSKEPYSLNAIDPLALFARNMKYGKTFVLSVRKPISIEEIQFRIHQVLGKGDW